MLSLSMNNFRYVFLKRNFQRGLLHFTYVAIRQRIVATPLNSDVLPPRIRLRSE